MKSGRLTEGLMIKVVVWYIVFAHLGSQVGPFADEDQCRVALDVIETMGGYAECIEGIAFAAPPPASQ